VESGAQSDGQNEHRFKTAELEFLIEDWNLLTTDDRRRTIAIVNGWRRAATHVFKLPGGADTITSPIP